MALASYPIMSASVVRSLLAVWMVCASVLAEADPASDAARAVAVAGAGAGAPQNGLQQEVTALHSRLTPPGAPALTPDGRPMNELAGVQYRLWMSHGRADLGIGLGTLGYVQPPIDPRADGPVTLSGASPLVSIGMRYRLNHESAFFADASGVHALAPDTSGAYVSTKVGMEWQPAKSRLGLDGGALGFQLDSGYKLAVKARRDGLGLYLRGKF
jgi:hypothetical protein